MRAPAYYNEIDPEAVAILRQCIADGVIAPGDVDTRSITEVHADDLRPYRQCHFFAGGGLWSVAARLAGWPDDRALWTGSCPCQPHSAAAADRRLKFADVRDLWPVWFDLIRAFRPDAIAGEQVDDNAAWIDRTASDMEGAGFAFGALDLPACAVDAPHERMRSYFVAHADRAGQREQGRTVAVAPEQFPAERAGGRSCFGHYRTTGELGRARRHEPGVPLLDHDVPGRVALLRVGGNAINPVLAAEVIGALADVMPHFAPEARAA